jgi:hypothetical protein
MREEQAMAEAAKDRPLSDDEIRRAFEELGLATEEKRRDLRSLVRLMQLAGRRRQYVCVTSLSNSSIPLV